MTVTYAIPAGPDARWTVTDSKPLRPPANPGPYSPALRLTVETGWSPPVTVDVPRNQAATPATITAYLKPQMEALYYAAKLTGTVITSVTTGPPDQEIRP